MKLVIVESPSKAKTIQKYLGRQYKVLASGGHIRDLPDKRLGIKIDEDFLPQYVLNAKNKEYVQKIKDALKVSDGVYLATDPDREGEAISWHLAQVLQLNSNPLRIEFNEISKQAVQRAIENPRVINQRLVDAQQARRVLDRLVGYRISPVLGRKIKRGISGGRVQSAALKMITDREEEILAFTPEEYWSLIVMLYKEGKKNKAFKAIFQDINGKKTKLAGEEQVRGIEQELEKAAYTIAGVKKSVTKVKPFAPFTTSTLQQDASIKLNIPVPRVMQLAQQLYEGLSIEGMGQTALVTYIRTDSVRVSQDFGQQTLEYIKEKYGQQYAPAKQNIYKAKSQTVQDAHEAIRPISLEVTPDSIEGKVPAQLFQVYRLIYNRYLASQMNPAEYDTVSADIVAKATENTYGFKVFGRTMKFEGYTIVYNGQKGNEEENEQLPELAKDDILLKDKILSEQRFTKAPPRYTDASLVKAMEENGIGRPSTYANVIGTLSKREYTQKEKSTIKPTFLGMSVSKFLQQHFEDIVDINFTANVENKLDHIENGSKWQEVIEEFYPPFMNQVQKAYKAEYKAIPKKLEVTDEKCAKCGAFMVVRESRYGKFLGCSNFPECDYKQSIIEKVATCPDCGKEIVKKRTKRGKVFYGCSNYPKCTFASWDFPAPYRCPKCNGIMKTVNKDGETLYQCINSECKNAIIPKS